MGLEEVVAEILGEANSRADAIGKEGKAKAAEILKAAEAELREKKSRAAEDLESVKSAAERKEIADAELSCKKMLQDAKKELIAASYDGLRVKLAAMGEKDRAKILGVLFERSAKQLADVGAVYVSGQDVKIASALLKPKKVAVKEKNILGGLIAESSDGRMLVDYSFDSIIESMKDRAIKDISRILF